MAEPTSIGLAAGWVAKLANEWTSIRQKRQKEIDDIVNTFGGDPDSLAKLYVEPDCQPNNPADTHEEGPIGAFRTPISTYVNRFIKTKVSFDPGGQNVVFFLGDAGMGKTSLLVMLKFTHMLKFWPDIKSFLLLKIGEDTIETLAKATDRRNTVLLLDALDEDRIEEGKIEERLLELLDASKGFRNIFVTCRTQFFPKGHIEGVGKIEVGGYVCFLAYLSLFSDEQVDEYLTNKFSKQSKIASVKEAMKQAGSLKMRPLILSYIDDLMGDDVDRNTSFKVYEALVKRWLWREERKLRARHGSDAPKAEHLWRACEIVACELQAVGRTEIPPDELEYLLGIREEVRPIRSIDVGGRALLNRKADGSYRFAHYSIQEFLVVHCLLDRRDLYADKLHATDQIWDFFREWIRSVLPGGRIITAAVRRFGVHLGPANLQSAYLRQADLEWANLQGARLQGANLQEANLQKANLQGANLQGANLQGAILQRANLHDADLQGANLQRAELRWADLQGAYLRRANLQGANLHEAILQRAYLRGANLQGANLREANLLGADLEGADLGGAILFKANLYEADLHKAILSEADLRGAGNLSRDQLAEAIIDEDSRLPDHFELRREELLLSSKRNLERQRGQ